MKALFVKVAVEDEEGEALLAALVAPYWDGDVWGADAPLRRHSWTSPSYVSRG